MRFGSARSKPPAVPMSVAPSPSSRPPRSARGTEPPAFADDDRSKTEPGVYPEDRARTEPGLPAEAIAGLAPEEAPPSTVRDVECYDGAPVQGDLETPSWLTCQDDVPQSINVRRCRLEVISGPGTGQSVELAQPTIVIGRKGADLTIDDPSLSRLHAELYLEASGYRLRDLGSTNGTHVRGVKIVEAYIKPDSVISLGKSEVRFQALPDAVIAPLWQSPRLCGLVGQSTAMRYLFELIERIAASDATVLISGETGSGKEGVADAIHERSPRAKKPFVVLDCSAIPAQLFEDQLFGHEAGAFTGATRAAVGVFEAAHGGTLFLDEIGELPLELQAKLLRAVETRTIRRVGGTKAIHCDVRVLAATNRDLAVEVNRGTFRADLYFRLAVAKLAVPPLRDRREDIPLLVEHFSDQLGAKPPAEFMTWALAQPWPGNVRELRNAVERATVLPSQPPGSHGPGPTTSAWPSVDVAVPFKVAKQRVVDEFDRRYLEALMSAHDGNISAAARAAGVDRMSIYKMMRRLGIAGADDVKGAPRERAPTANGLHGGAGTISDDPALDDDE
jgi:two-component system response regulator GlrR